MSWVFNSDATFDMEITFAENSWVGMGFCPSMTNCDMLAI